MRGVFSLRRFSREIWERPAVVFVATFVVYNLVFLHLALPTYEHHDSYVALGLRPHCSGFDWYGVWTGRPLHAFALCWATMLGDGLALAEAFRIAACLSIAAAAGLFASLLSRHVPRSVAALFALTAFSLPGAVLIMTMFQATFFAFCLPLLLAIGVVSILVFRAPFSRGRLLLVSAAQLLALLCVLELYQPILPLIFLPILVMVFFDRQRLGKVQLAPVVHLTILFVLASVCYLISIKIIHAVVSFPPGLAVDSRNVDVSLSPMRLIEAVAWIWSTEIAQLSSFWFINHPHLVRYLQPLALLAIPLGIGLRALDAWRLAPASGPRPKIAAGAVLASVAIVLLVGDYLAFVVSPTDRFLLGFERVKWSYQILLLVPIFYLTFRVVTWRRLNARARLLVGGVIAVFALVAIINVQDLMLRGRVLVGVSERLFVQSEIRRQLALGKSAQEIAAIWLTANPYPHQLNDELFLLTSSAHISSLEGMLRLFANDLGLHPERVTVIRDGSAYGVNALEEQARARNLILIDFRQFPGAAMMPRRQAADGVQATKLVVCHAAIDPTQISGDLNLPIVTIGEPGHADIFYLRRQGDKVVLGIDNWGVSHKETVVSLGEIANKLMEMTVDYSRDTGSLAIEGREVVWTTAGISSWLSSRKPYIGTNPLQYPGFAPSFPEVARMAESGAAACDVRSQ